MRRTDRFVDKANRSRSIYFLIRKLHRLYNCVHLILILIQFYVSDVTVIPLQSVNAEAGGNVSLSCPGVTEQSLVLTLEWRVNEARILEYSSSSTTVWKHENRVSLTAENFALFFHPVTSVDSGDYYCLVNNRPMPEAIVKLMVQGESLPRKSYY